MALQVLLQPEWDNRGEWYSSARKYGFGVEIISFALTTVLNDDTAVEQHLAAYESELSPFAIKTLHGPFIDIIPHSPDRLIAEVSRQRIVACLDIAQRLRASHVVVHTGINWQIRNPGYIDRVADTQAEFWSRALEEHPGVTVCLENMWEPHPAILRRIVEQTGHSRLKVCFDVGHAHVFSPTPLEAWLEELADEIVYLHLNDNHGDQDSELALGRGNINWSRFFESLRGKPAGSALTTLEVNSLDAVAESTALLIREGIIGSEGGISN